MATVCDVCGAPAVWMYGPGDRPEANDFCAEHVPRGCYCNRDADDYEHLDTDGRRLPCVDYTWIGPAVPFPGGGEE